MAPKAPPRGDKKKSKKRDEPNARAVALQMDDRRRLQVESSPLARATTTREVKLPSVPAPSLEGIQVRVPPPPAITEPELLEAFQLLLREHATVRDRALGEKVASGDEVLVDTLGYANGRLIPYSARSEMWMTVTPQPMLPGLAEALVGVDVGDGKKVDVVLPSDYPVPELRGARATFLVDIREAREVTLPNPEDPATLARLGLGSSLDDVMRALADEMMQARTEELLIEGQDRVLDELAARVTTPIPAALVDEEIRRRWGDAEAKLLATKGFAPDELEEAAQGWLRDPDMRVDAERRIRISLALKAIIEQEGIKPTREAVSELLDDVAPALGISVEEAREALKREPSQAANVINTALHMMAVNHVMERAQVTYEDAPA